MCETEQHSMAQVLTSGTQRAVYILSLTHEHVIFVLVCVCLCVLRPLGRAFLLFLIWTVGGGGRILAIGTKTQNLDVMSVQES